MIGIKIITLIFAILSASTTPLMIFDQNAQGQTATLTVNYTCDENNQPVGTINLNGFPEGPVSIFRFEQSQGTLYLGGVTVPSSGTTTFPSEPELMGIQSGDIVTYTVVSDPNQNGVLDPGEVSATTTVIFSCPPSSSPPQQIQNLINTINEMNLASGIRNSLTAPLSQAVNILQDNNPNNDIAACNQLNAFIQQVNAQTQNNSLTQEQSNQLIQAAQSIRNALNCS
jgi:hypothetical protein